MFTTDPPTSSVSEVDVELLGILVSAVIDGAISRLDLLARRVYGCQDQGMADSPTWRVHPSDLPALPISDAHIEGDIEVRLVSREPFILENTFAPGTRLPLHSHGCDTLYIFKSGEFHIEGEGVFTAGDIRFVRAGHAYGPEWAGDEGAVLQIIGLAPGFNTVYPGD